MNDELERRADSWKDMREDVFKLAQALQATPFVNKEYRGNGAAVAAAILTGREMGLGPMASVRGIHFVDGRPTLSAQLLTARIFAAGHTIEWGESTDTRCTVTIGRGDGLSMATVTWTIKDAERAGLAGKRNWLNYPRHMLKARALSECAGMVCPDVILGLDARDAPDEPTQNPAGGRIVVQVDATPQPVAGGQPEGGPRGATGDGNGGNQPPVAQDQGSTPPAASVQGVSRRQLTAIHTKVGALERIRGKRLTEDERRAFILSLAGADDLPSSRDLTEDEASEVINKLEAMISQPVED